jgi:hypothetical protein
MDTSLERHVPADGVGAEIPFAHARVNAAADIVSLDVAAICVDVGRAREALQGHVTVVGGHHGHAALGNLNGQISTPIIRIRRPQGHVATVHHQPGREGFEGAPG